MNTLEYFVTFWYILEYSRIKWNDNDLEYSIISWSILEYSKIFQNIPKYYRIFPLESCSRAVLYMDIGVRDKDRDRGKIKVE